MKTILRAFVFRVSSLLVLAMLLPATAFAAAQRTVIIISMDGVSGELLEKTMTPALDGLARAGGRVQRLVPPFPSNTFPAHASIATGTYPDKHGIVNNKFVDRKRGRFNRERPASWLRAEPLWVTAERQGVRSGVIMWVTSEGDWRGSLPSFYMKFRRDDAEEKKIDRILSWLSRPPAARPRLIMAWFRGSDDEGHRHGHLSEEAVRQLQREDRLVARLLVGLDRNGLRRSTVVMVISDHGMIPLQKIVNLKRALEAGGLGGNVATSGGMSQVYLDAPWETERAYKILSMPEWLQLYRPEDLPSSWNALAEGRVGELVAVANPGVGFSEDPSSIVSDHGGRRLGGHGYPPGVPGTDGFLVAAGPGIRKGTKISSAEAIDIYPTVCALLGIKAAKGIDGQPIGDLLAPESKSREERPPEGRS